MRRSIHLFLFCVAVASLSGCMNYRRLITDEVVLKDGNTHTGTIQRTDSTHLSLMKADESTIIIPWSAVNTIQGKKLRTLWLGVNTGYYQAPYFSVFRNERMTGRSAGIQYKAGLAYRGTRMYYLQLSFLPARPYGIVKSGFGFQRYLFGRTYLRDNCLFAGGELNFMSVKFNNAAQLTFEPFAGYEKKLNEHLRLHFKFQLQLNLANKNSATGFSTTVGLHFMRKNFKKRYEYLNSEHKVMRR